MARVAWKPISPAVLFSQPLKAGERAVRGPTQALCLPLEPALRIGDRIQKGICACVFIYIYISFHSFIHSIPAA